MVLESVSDESEMPVFEPRLVYIIFISLIAHHICYARFWVFESNAAALIYCINLSIQILISQPVLFLLPCILQKPNAHKESLYLYLAAR